MKAVYTYFAPTVEQEAAGFTSARDMAMFLSLSVEYAKKHFKKVELFTDKKGKALLIDKYKVGFTSVDTSLEGLQIHHDLWAYAKVKTYSLQKEPFVHIDLDCVLWEKLPAKLLKSDIFFQNKDTFDIQPGYPGLIRLAEGTTIGYTMREAKVDYACNCGVVGVRRLDLAQKWHAMARDFIFNPHNKAFWDQLGNKQQMNYVFEQFFISCVMAKEKVKPAFMITKVTHDKLALPDIKFTHVWGDHKRNADEIEKFRARLKKEFPSVYKRVTAVKPCYKSLFSDFFKKGSWRYQASLKRAIDKHDVKSVVYLGYDGLKSSRYVDLEKSVDFLYSGGSKSLFPECDLLIVKDVVGHWSGEELKEFSAQWKKRAKLIMDGSGVYK